MAGTAWIRDIEVVVFDVLGTLVDDVGGLRTAIREALSASAGAGAGAGAGGEGAASAAGDAALDAYADELLGVWQQHVQLEEQRIGQGQRPYADTAVIDAEAARRVAGHAGIDDPAAVSRLATTAQRLPPFGDSVAGLERLARRLPVLALSNAGRTALLRLDAHAGLRWHQTLSAETVQAYKPAPEVYRLALDTAGCPPERALMVAAHAWDLRGARANGMRTAYVHRPGGDPPTSADAFDLRFDAFDELVTALTTTAADPRHR
ncbi:haloacid dehalogenase type II [Streptomyces sp. HNM0575]|uniref:haloacid dehalogenase type II n=1 Tax=Streptomyces sp. HNM0575 TaxID=2716338 RepID=UPI00145F0A4B|nr:haloacid dehalogenase type II [Streptomyces sp. HNM0575]NLU75597.1 haloacid dehalogenase type II [Streptomyces sp. HNM0575]